MWNWWADLDWYWKLLILYAVAAVFGLWCFGKACAENNRDE